MSVIDLIRRCIRPLGATPIGLTLIALFALYAALGTLPLFPAPESAGQSAESGQRVPIRALAWISKSQGAYFAWWPGVALLVGIVVNMSASMLTRVPWRWSKAPVLMTHAGVALLALGSALYAAQKIEGQVVLLAPEAGEQAGPQVSEMTDGSGENPRPIPGVALALQDVRIEMVPGTDVPRRVTLDVRAVAGGAESAHVVSLNQPLVLEGMSPPTCDCFIRGPIERLWHGWINPVRWKFSLAGWDQEGWTLSREAAIAGMTDRPRARFALLGVGNTPGVRIIAAGALMMLAGMLAGVVGGMAGGLFPGGESPALRGPSTDVDSTKRGAPSGRQPIEAREGDAHKDPGSVIRRGVTVGAGAALLALLPFAPPARASEIDPVASLRTLPVQWNGRIAALDTVARDIVRAFSARERVPDAVHGVPEDPLLTLLDLMLRPDENLDRPLISPSGVGRASRLVEAGVGPNVGGSGLLSIREAESVLRRITAGSRGPRTPPEATRLAERVAVARLGFRALPMVAPDRAVSEFEASDWLDPLSERSPPPITAALERLRDAWRGGGGRGHDGTHALDVMLEARRFATALRGHNEGRYDAWRVWFEVLSNRLSLLSWSGWLYGVGAGLLLVSMLRHPGIAAKMGGAVVGAAWMLHAGGFVSRWIIAGRLPIQNQYESMIGLSLGVVAVAAIIAGVRRVLVGRCRSVATVPDFDAVSGPGRLLVFGAALTAFVVLTASHALPVPGRTIEPEAAILGTATLLKYHVTTVLLAYGFIALSAVAASVWIVSRLVRPSRTDLHDGAARLLRPLCHAAFVVLTVGILLGALWADRAWGRWWAFDPKETWALITWMVYLAATHLRADASASRAALAILGAAVMTWSWFGVNLLIPGLHAYAGNGP